MGEVFRPDLTVYARYVELLQEKLNDEGAYRMSMTDVVKIAVERLMEGFCPEVKVDRARKLYIRLEL